MLVTEPAEIPCFRAVALRPMPARMSSATAARFCGVRGVGFGIVSSLFHPWGSSLSRPLRHACIQVQCSMLWHSVPPRHLAGWAVGFGP